MRILRKFSQLPEFHNIMLIATQQRFYTAESITTEWENAKPLSTMPGYGKWEFFCGFLPGGKFHNKDFMAISNRIRKEMGDLVYTPPILGLPARIIAFDPRDIEKFLRNDGPIPDRIAFQVLTHHRTKLRKSHFGDVTGTLVANGEDWAKFRSAVNPVLMQPKIVKSYFGRMSKVADDFIERIKSIRNPTTLEMPDDFIQDMHRWALESVALVALNKRLGLIHGQGQNVEEANEFFKHLNVFFEKFTDVEVRPPIWKLIETKSFKEVIKSLDYITDFVEKHIKAALAELEAKNETELADEEKSVLEKLLKIDSKIANVMAIDMFFGGVESTTSTLTGILLCLSKHSEKQAKLRAEILKVLPEKHSTLTIENTKNLPYLRACIKESLRMYPVAPAIVRNTTKDFVLNGYRIPKGSYITLISEPIQRDPAYFPHPDEFQPERWLHQTNNDTTSTKVTHPFAYIPFGFGPRSCVGRRLAELELELSVMKIVRNFQVEFNHSTENLYKNNLINIPVKPLKFKFIDL